MRTLRGRLLLDGALVAGTLHLEGGRIARVERDEAAHGRDLPVVAPGFVDLHVHGAGGAEPLADLEGMARALVRAGTTAFQPTLFPAAPERLGAQAERVWTRSRELGARSGAARVVGLHLEGPFVNPEAAGALPREELAPPSVAALRAILGPATGDGRGITTMTVAPELDGALELVAELVQCGVRASLGHSRATAAEARAAAQAGASAATHLYNAMPRFHHREAGLAGFALSTDALAAELIGDLVHVGREALELALAARGTAGLCLVSDALEGAGTGCERFEARGREHHVRDGAVYWKGEDGAERLTGSALMQLEQVRRLVRAGVLALPEALTLASESPARALGLSRELGRLAEGLAADLVVLSGDDLRLDAVWIAGEPLQAVERESSSPSPAGG